MSRIVPLAAACASALLIVACSDPRPGPAAPSVSSTHAVPGEAGERARLEALARHVARALDDAALRADLLAALRASSHPEGKLQFGRWLEAGNGRALAALARAAGLTDQAVRTLAADGLPLEFYLPVPAHRTAWGGGSEVLVATAFRDHEAPVAFTTRGKKRRLDPVTPPTEPVLALVPQESNLDPRPRLAECQTESCSGGGGGGSGGGGALPRLSDQHLKLTYAWFNDDYEGWLRGDPEYELHILGPSSTDPKDEYVSYQCIGEHAPVGYRWDMNGRTWTGNQLLFTGTQMDNLEKAYPGKSFSLLAIEDDDGACEIKMDRDLLGDFFDGLTAIYGAYRGSKDIKLNTPEGIKRLVDAGKASFNIVTAFASLLKTNDELIGAAVADTVAGRAHPVGNWVVVRDNDVNGWLRLEVKP